MITNDRGRWPPFIEKACPACGQKSDPPSKNTTNSLMTIFIRMLRPHTESSAGHSYPTMGEQRINAVRVFGCRGNNRSDDELLINCCRKREIRCPAAARFFLTVTQTLAAAAPEPSAFASLATSLVLLALAGAAGGGVEAEDPPITAEGSGVEAHRRQKSMWCLGLAIPPDYARDLFRQSGAVTAKNTASPDRDMPVMGAKRRQLSLSRASRNQTG